jgi:hypothetical protein
MRMISGKAFLYIYYFLFVILLVKGRTIKSKN